MSAFTAVSDDFGPFPIRPISPGRQLTYNTRQSKSVEPSDGEITKLLDEAAGGRQEALNRLFQLVRPRLHEIAAVKMRREKAGHTWTPTDLIHEAFLRLAGQKPPQNRAQLYGTFAMVMRWVLVDHAKQKLSERRGGGWRRVPLDENLFLPSQQVEELLAVHQCLEKLEREYPRPAKIVELRFFGALSFPEIAEHLGVSLSTVEADWRFARAWLHVELEGAAVRT